MNITRAMGHAFLWIGFLGAAFATVNTTEISREWHKTIATPNYLIPCALGVIGVLMLRATSGKRNLDDEAHVGQLVTIEQELDALCNTLTVWEQANTVTLDNVCRLIDRALVEHLASFANDRQALIDSYGLPVYASIMTEFATGERFVNRAWSAGADGYLEESRSSLARANRHFTRAQELLAQQRAHGDERVTDVGAS